MSSSGVFEFESQSQRFIKIDSIAGLDCRDGLRAVSQSSNVSIGLKGNLIKVNKNGKQSAYYLDNDFVCLHSMTPPPVFIEDTIAVISNINGFSHQIRAFRHTRQRQVNQRDSTNAQHERPRR